jgi:hypothetical protein
MRFSMLLIVPVILSRRADHPRPLLSAGVPACSVAVLSPQAGDRVKSPSSVTGSAVVPEGTHLWVLARHQGLQGWWPQGGGAAEIHDGKWDVYVTYGTPGELGTFELAVIVVGAQGDADLRRWVNEAGPGYAPTQMPATIEECPTRRLTVEKP